MMKKIAMSIALVAAMVLGTTAYAQTPSKKEVKKEQTASMKKEVKADKAKKESCSATKEGKCEKAAPAKKADKKK
ncbi:MAG: hypothetical protein RR365_01320 [Bacteroides sp.]